MIIFFLTLAYPCDKTDRNLYSDLMDEITARGHKAIVFRPDDGTTSLVSSLRGSVQVVTVKSGKITKNSYLNKAINTILLGRRYKKALKQVMTDIVPQLLIYSTPPITFLDAIDLAKKNSGCETFLLLKDIFPANACDIGLIRRGGLMWRHFRKMEKKLYAISDRIGCMSQANVDYILRNNSGIPETKALICPNSIRPTPLECMPVADAAKLNEYGIPLGSFRLIYGGNLGRPQCVPFIIKILFAAKNDPTFHIVIVGDGTDYSLLEEYAGREGANSNFTLIRKLPKTEYCSLLSCMDVGLIFLDSDFTIPNYPSRILDYMDYGIPIIAATDTITDVRMLLENDRCGLWSRCGDTDAFLFNVRRLRDNAEERMAMGRRGREILLTRFSAHESADIILSLSKSNKNVPSNVKNPELKHCS